MAQCPPMNASRGRPGFGSAPKVPRPIVLLIVFGLFLVVVGVTTTAQTILVSAHFSNAALNQVVASDAATIRSFVNLNLSDQDLTGAPSAARRAALSTALVSLVRNGDLLHLEIRLPDGTIVASEDPSLGGTQAPVSADFSTALRGSIVPTMLDAQGASESEVPLTPPSVLREYLPVSTDG